ncbi:MAG: amino acid ABC transporter permease [Aminobacterium sp.]|jgi:polar amino acid transport system permease protein|nr:amino acid ABC transporter permease [Aminobacterium sp.]MDD3425859.1 amino acid ABC transporter permease [Aminobacterium sp.]MDD4228346.1 amino acid ABC transporter permease [Aminobacterium sp.]MDD4551817.1 amino acid ABC transporter permease [Aminobacterium sp.]
MESITVVIESLPYLLQGTLVTLRIVALALALGLCMGLPLAVAQVYGSLFLQRIVKGYVWIFRGLPNLVLLFLFFFGIFPSLGIDASAFFTAVVVLGLRSAAYQSQIFRGSILSLGEGQMLAARSLGMSKIQAVTWIILPQAIRLALPGWSNEYPILLTDSSVTYAIGVLEILTRANLVVSRTYQPMPIFLTCAIIFILLNYGGMQLLHFVENKLRIPGYGNGE